LSWDFLPYLLHPSQWQKKPTLLSNRSPTRQPCFFNSHFLSPFSLCLFTPSFMCFFFSNTFNTPNTTLRFFLFRCRRNVTGDANPRPRGRKTLPCSALSSRRRRQRLLSLLGHSQTFSLPHGYQIHVSFYFSFFILFIYLSVFKLFH